MNNVIKYINDHKLELVKNKRIILSKFGVNNRNLYLKYYNSNIEELQGLYYWNELTKRDRDYYSSMGYNEIIWNKYSSPIRYNLPHIFKLIEDKKKIYYFNIMVSKCILKRETYKKKIEWIKIKLLQDNNRILQNNFIFNQLPIDLFKIIINYIE